MIDVIRINGYLVVTVLAARLDAETSVDFRRHTQRLVNKGEREIILDMSQVDLVDASGAWAIVNLLKRVGPEGVLKVAGAQVQLQKLFATTGLDTIVAQSADLTEASMRTSGVEPEPVGALASIGKALARLAPGLSTGARTA